MTVNVLSTKEYAKKPTRAKDVEVWPNPAPFRWLFSHFRRPTLAYVVIRGECSNRVALRHTLTFVGPRRTTLGYEESARIRFHSPPTA